MNSFFLAMNRYVAWLACALLMAMPWPARAGELVYMPTNPTFGGNPNNASGLMAIASAQNDYKAPTTTLTPQQKFINSVQSAVLARMSRAAVTQLFDTYGNPVLGTVVSAGDFTIEFVAEEGTGNITLVTRDIATGGETRVEIGRVAEAETTATVAPDVN